MPPSAQLKRVRRIGYALYIILMVVALLIAVFVLRQHKPSRIEHRQAIAVLHHGGGFFLRLPLSAEFTAVAGLHLRR